MLGVVGSPQQRRRAIQKKVWLRRGQQRHQEVQRVVEKILQKQGCRLTRVGGFAENLQMRGQGDVFLECPESNETGVSQCRLLLVSYQCVCV